MRTSEHGPRSIARDRSSNLDALLVAKLFFPAFFLLFDYLILSSADRDHVAFQLAFMVAPATLAAAVGLTIAQVRATPDGVHYRRLLRWHFLPYRDIRRAGRAWACGYLLPRRALPPWGAVFFGLSRSLRLRNPLLEYIQDGVAHGRSTEVAESQPQSGRPRWRDLAWPVLLGAAVTLLFVFLTPSDLLHNLAQGRYVWLPASRWYAARIATLPVRPPWCALTAAILLYLAARGHRTRLCAIAAGAALAWLAVALPLVR